MDDDAAIQWVRGVIRQHMVAERISYAALTRALREKFDLEGDEWNEKNVANKVSRGTFSAVFFVQCLEAMGVSDVKLDMAKRVVSNEDPDDPDEIGDFSTDARLQARVREIRNRGVGRMTQKDFTALKRQVNNEVDQRHKARNQKAETKQE